MRWIQTNFYCPVYPSFLQCKNSTISNLNEIVIFIWRHMKRKMSQMTVETLFVKFFSTLKMRLRELSHDDRDFCDTWDIYKAMTPGEKVESPYSGRMIFRRSPIARKLNRMCATCDDFLADTTRNPATGRKIKTYGYDNLMKRCKPKSRSRSRSRSLSRALSRMLSRSRSRSRSPAKKRGRKMK